MAAFLGPLAVMVFLMGTYALVWVHTWAGVIVYPVALFVGWGAYQYGQDAPLTADDRAVTYTLPLGSPRSCHRSEVVRIDRLSGRYGTSSLRFIRRDGSVALTVDQTYDQADVEALAKDLGVPLNWNAGWSTSA